MNRIDISMCWDGRTPTAELLINGMSTEGHPDDVQVMFDLLNELRNRSRLLEQRLLRVQAALNKADEETWR